MLFQPFFGVIPSVLKSISYRLYGCNIFVCLALTGFTDGKKWVNVYNYDEDFRRKYLKRNQAFKNDSFGAINDIHSIAETFILNIKTTAGDGKNPIFYIPWCIKVSIIDIWMDETEIKQKIGEGPHRTMNQELVRFVL